MGLNERIRAARGKMSQEDFGEALGVSRGSIAHWERSNAPVRPRQPKIELIAELTGVSLNWLMTGDGPMRPVTNNLNQNELGPLMPVAHIPVIGSVKAGGWLRVDELNTVQDVEFPSIGVVMKYPKDWQYAFTVEGTSLNKVANEGDTLVCVDMIKSGMEITDNKLVIVERTMHDGSMIERTAKRVRKTSFGFELWPESTDPAHQEPIVINGGSQHEEVRIKAVVVFVVKEP